MKNLRWGILSTADIGITKVIPAIQRAEHCEVVAIASRTLDRAAAAAARLGIPTAYGSYEELLAAGDVDAVYIPLPNDGHAEWTIKAAGAGKHVLCEKPLALSSAQAEEMARACAAAGVKLGEAFMYRHHSAWVETVRLVRTGAIGRLQAVQSFFSYYNDDPADIRNRVERGGGATMDIGCYCINLSRMLFGAEPSRIEVEIPFNIPPDRETRVLLTSGGDPPVAPATEARTFPPADQYSIQASLFARAVLEGTGVPVPIEDAVANMKV
ncbi:MAG: NAD-binding protein, partial [Actinobacteria bacterium RBG_16_70_17]